MPSAMESKMADQAMSANHEYSSPHYTSADNATSERIMRRVNSQFAHYGGLMDKDYAGKVFDKTPIGTDGANNMDHYRSLTGNNTNGRLKDMYKNPLIEMMHDPMYKSMN